MLLGLSALQQGATTLDDTNVNGSAAAGHDGGVDHGALLTRFAEAVHEGDTETITARRTELVEAVGPRAAADAAAVCANFNMMVRIADGTGTPLDGGTVTISVDARARLGLDDYASARI